MSTATAEVKPKRIQRKRTKGWTMPPNTVYVGRPTRWGNPFRVAAADKSERAIAAYRALLMLDYKWFREHAGYSWMAGAVMTWSLKTHVDVVRLLEPLRGKDLACWCKEGAPCHADILLELANQ